MKDLTNPAWIKAKGILFLFLGVVSAVLLFFERPTLRVAALLLNSPPPFQPCLSAARYFSFPLQEHSVRSLFKSLIPFLSHSCALFCVSFHTIPHSLPKNTGVGGTPALPYLATPIFRIFFQVPYALTPLFGTLTKTAGVWGYSSHFGTGSILSWPHESSRAERGICFFFRRSSLPSPSLRKRLRVDSRHQLQRIFVVHLLQDFVRHLEAVNPPERVALAVILKIFVPRFERPEIPLVFVHVVDVLAYQHTVLIFHQKIVRRIGLPPQFRQHCGDVHIHVRQRIESFPQPLQVVSMKPQMRRDEIRSRMPREKAIALRHQRLERRILRRRPRASRKFFQLLPALVVIVPRIEKRRRFRHVNQHGKLQLRAFFKDGVKFRIVRVHALSAGIYQIHSEILEDFQSLRAVLDVLFQASRHAFSKSRRVQIVKTHVRENDESIRIAPFHCRHSILQLLPGSSAEIHHHVQIDCVHFLDEPVHFLCRGIPVMAVNVDERKFRSLDFVLFGDERGLWLVLVDRRRLQLLRRLALLRHGRARPNDERSRSHNENSGNEEDGSPGIHSAPWISVSGLSSHRKADQ